MIITNVLLERIKVIPKDNYDKSTLHTTICKLHVKRDISCVHTWMC